METVRVQRVYDVLHRAAVLGILGGCALLCGSVLATMGAYVERLRRARRLRRGAAACAAQGQ